MRALWLAEVLRAGGLTVVEHDGWQTRGFQPWDPQFGIVHATAAPRSQVDDVQVAIVRDGRTGLAGPIANCCVDRAGRWHVLASGRCNTALTGWAGPANGIGNTGLLGVEACNDNAGEPWPGVQYDAYTRGWAAIARQLGWSSDRLVGHKEHQPGDKTDPTFNMSAFRAEVAQLIDGPSTEEDDGMKMILLQQRGGGTALHYVHPTTGELVWANAVTQDAVGGWKAAGVPVVDVDDIAAHGRNVAEVAAELLDALRESGGAGASAKAVADEIHARMES